MALTDGRNYGVTEATGNVTNIDKTVPTYSSVEVKNVNSKGYDVYVYGVKDTDSGVNRVQFPTWTEANGEDDLQKDWFVQELKKQGYNDGQDLVDLFTK